MALITYPLTVTITEEDNDPVAGAIVTAKLTKPDEDGVIITPDKQTVIADDAGVAVLNLWPNVRGTAGSQYQIKARHPGTGRRLLDVVVTMPATASTLTGIMDFTDARTPSYVAVNLADEAATRAEDSADAAATSETNVAANAAAAATSATNAADSATVASDSADDSAASASAAHTSKLNAAASKTAAAASASQASTSAGQASGSATAAATSETNAAASETAAANSASAADASADAAAISATNAANSATAAGTSETNASASETAAANSASAAAISENNASDSATAAATSESNAADSESAAAASAAAADTSEANAATSAGDASGSADLAHQWADNPQGVPVVAGEFSSMHWAKESQASATSAMEYVSTFDASTGSYPANPPRKGAVYKCSVAGTLDGREYAVGDMIIYNGGDATASTGWDKVDNTEKVTAVAGKVGDVQLNTADIDGIQPVAASGNYDDLTGTPNLSQIAVYTPGGATHELSAASIGRNIQFTAAGTLFIPDDATLNVPVGTVALASQGGTGAVTVQASTTNPGATVHAPNGDATVAQYETLFIRKIAANEWVVDAPPNLSVIGFKPAPSIIYNLTADALGKEVPFNDASACTLAIPDDATLVAAVGSVVMPSQRGQGAVTVAESVEHPGATVHAPNGTSTTAQYDMLFVRKIAANEWVVL